MFIGLTFQESIEVFIIIFIDVLPFFLHIDTGGKKERETIKYEAY